MDAALVEGQREVRVVVDRPRVEARERQALGRAPWRRDELPRVAELTPVGMEHLVSLEPRQRTVATAQRESGGHASAPVASRRPRDRAPDDRAHEAPRAGAAQAPGPAPAVAVAPRLAERAAPASRRRDRPAQPGWLSHPSYERACPTMVSSCVPIRTLRSRSATGSLEARIDVLHASTDVLHASMGSLEARIDVLHPSTDVLHAPIVSMDAPIDWLRTNHVGGRTDRLVARTDRPVAGADHAGGRTDRLVAGTDRVGGCTDRLWCRHRSPCCRHRP